jgi:hypothetical protein
MHLRIVQGDALNVFAQNNPGDTASGLHPGSRTKWLLPPWLCQAKTHRIRHPWPAELQSAITHISDKIGQEIPITVLETWINRHKWVMKHEGEDFHQSMNNERKRLKIQWKPEDINFLTPDRKTKSDRLHRLHFIQSHQFIGENDWSVDQVCEMESFSSCILTNKTSCLQLPGKTFHAYRIFDWSMLFPRGGESGALLIILEFQEPCIRCLIPSSTQIWWFNVVVAIAEVVLPPSAAAPWDGRSYTQIGLIGCPGSLKYRWLCHPAIRLYSDEQKYM